jgi:hypothetical protein
MFAKLGETLAKEGFRCVLLDLPGHGARMGQALTLDSAVAAIV